LLTSGEEQDRESLEQAIRFASRAGRALKIYALDRPCSGEQRSAYEDVEVIDVDDFEAWLSQAGGMACFVLFMSGRLYTQSGKEAFLHGLPFPVLLV